jgi:acetate kinase
VVVLCVNAGSSSLKVAVFDGERRVARGSVEGIGLPQGRLSLEPGNVSPGRFAGHPQALEVLLGAMEAFGWPGVGAVGHRLVHGGPVHHLPELLTPALLGSLRQVVPFAPLHLPFALACMEAVQARAPAVPQVACFDTAFHWNLPDVARLFPVPEAVTRAGVRRYGFHGLSYEYLVASLKLPGRAVLAHLGNGASMVAVRESVSVDTTMGLTPLGGFMMGTRSGDLDPGVLLFLLRSGMGVDALENLLERQSGLLGVSGATFDMRTLLETRSREPRAALAVDMFCYQCRKSVGALAASLGGLDALVFTGGIGERAAPVRAQICAGLEHLGIELDDARNQAHAAVISSPASRCIVRVITTDEDLVMARHAQRLLQ